MKLPIASCQITAARVVPMPGRGSARSAPQAISAPMAASVFNRSHAADWDNPRAHHHLSFLHAFTLLEVMIAIAIFFVSSFAILGLVSSSLDNVRRLQRPSVDASPVLARYAATNSLTEGVYQGSLGDPELLGKDYRDYNYVVDIEEVRTNHLYSVRCIIKSALGNRQVVSDMATVLYKPHSPPGSMDGGIGLTGH